ncbi:hypothetical protein RHGRI_022948 [Rhododendron griersonianum]|uniref:Expansin-like EG45 domain-containing protein n=1 Tax=Rhododendron griersonianum TaxID=479676 RepID=A0AAV6J3E0_9ERIC|nr:hypothetical protein RHGRI_022948 [Rhododendron griersonianum]
MWDGPKICGRKYSIVCTGSAMEGVPESPCTGGGVVVTIVDMCLATESCGNFGLSAAAFSQISRDTDFPIAINYTE